MRRLRATRRLTQEALAYDYGINRILSAVERAERNVSIDNAHYLLRVLAKLSIEIWIVVCVNAALECLCNGFDRSCDSLRQLRWLPRGRLPEISEKPERVLVYSFGWCG